MPNILDFSARECERYLTDSIFKIKGELFRFRGIALYDEEDDTYAGWDGLRLVEGEWESTNYYLEEMSALDIDITFPSTGYIAYDKSVLYVHRIPARQWNLGYNPHSISFSDVQRNERSIAGLSSLPNSNYGSSSIKLSPAFVKAVFYPKYSNFFEAVNKVRRGAVLGTPISKHLAIGQSAHSSMPVLFYKTKIIGWVDDTNLAHIYKEADYVSLLLPFNFVIEEAA